MSSCYRTGDCKYYRIRLHDPVNLNITLQYGMSNLEAISKKFFRPISVLIPRLKSSTYLSMRVEDPVNRRDGLILGLAFLSRHVLAGDLDQKS